MPGHWEAFTPKFRKAVLWMPKRDKTPLSEDELRRIFMEHDKDRDGHLDKAELKEAFRRLGSKAAAYRAGRAIHYLDMDVDGVINENEIDHLVSYASQCGYSLN